MELDRIAWGIIQRLQNYLPTFPGARPKVDYPNTVICLNKLFMIRLSHATGLVHT